MDAVTVQVHGALVLPAVRLGLPLLILTLTLALLAPDADGQLRDAVDAESRSITLLLGQDPPQLDSTRSTDAISIRILGHVKEGLTRYDERNQLTGGVAERWEIREDGATFWLREDARWSDGEAVTAEDFVYAWRRVQDPATTSEYAFIMYGVENAEAVNTGQLPPEALGVRAVNDHVLEVSFERPIPFFARLTAFAVFLPVREDFATPRGDRYGSGAADMLYNGPFVISRWVRGARLTLERNPHYWENEAIWLNRIDFGYITADTRTGLNLFQDGKVAMANLDSETMHNALQQRWRIHRFDDGVLFYVGFNHRPTRLTRNLNLRRALELTFDPNEFVNRIIATPGNRPGISVFPAWMQGAEGRLRQEIPPAPSEVDLERARAHLELAREELGLASFPPLVLLTGDSPTANKQAEYLQSMWGQTLGLEIRVDVQIFRQRLAKMTAGDYDMVLAGWGPDYNDPLTFGDLFASWNLNNRGRYASDEFDRWVLQAQQELDPHLRVEAFGEIQRIVDEDVVVIPTYERAQLYVVHPRLKGVVRRQISPDPDFTRAWIEQAD